MKRKREDHHTEKVNQRATEKEFEIQKVKRIVEVADGDEIQRSFPTNIANRQLWSLKRQLDGPNGLIYHLQQQQSRSDLTSGTRAGVRIDQNKQTKGKKPTDEEPSSSPLLPNNIIKDAAFTRNNEDRRGRQFNLVPCDIRQRIVDLNIVGQAVTLSYLYRYIMDTLHVDSGHQAIRVSASICVKWDSSTKRWQNKELYRFPPDHD
ncbi:hypothetical protein BGZ76_000036 [Entomortierella beljakovae]|nr:hypothetical protein BGZ76_000036 [Entomortierella beljakovae]